MQTGGPITASTSTEKADFEEKSRSPDFEDLPVCDGHGTDASPYIVRWEAEEAANPQNWSLTKKWAITATMATATLAIAFGSSVVSPALGELVRYFDTSVTVVTLTISLYVLGFALGPLLWAPFSEQWGRRPVFIATYGLFAVFNIPSAVAKNVETVLICRFLAGFFGSAPLTNSGGVIGDMFSASERAVAMSLFSAAPMSGPIIGPIVGGFMIASSSSPSFWRWLFVVPIIFAFVMFVLGSLVPETYAPVLLRRRAAHYSRRTGKVYRSMFDLHPSFSAPLTSKMKVALVRPFLLLAKEPICLLFALYAAIVYGMLYCFFGAYPLVYEYARGWSPGISGLAFLPVGLGTMLAIGATIYDNKRYIRKLAAAGGVPLPPEERLPLCCIAGVLLPLGLFGFAWSSLPRVHWIVSMIFSVPFGFSMVAMFLSTMTYLVDSYLMFAASALASNAVLRSLLGFAFPLFTRQMFSKLGNQWALTLLAFLALIMAPIPFIFYRYGPAIRAKSTYAHQHKVPPPAQSETAVSPTVTRIHSLEEGVAAPELAKERSGEGAGGEKLGPSRKDSLSSGGSGAEPERT